MTQSGAPPLAKQGFLRRNLSVVVRKDVYNHNIVCYYCSYIRISLPNSYQLTVDIEMSFRRTLLEGVNKALNPLNVHVLPLHEYKSIRSSYSGPQWTAPPLQAEVVQYLNWDNPALEDLHRRYAGHPASSHSQWNSDTLRKSIDLLNFRGDNHYVYETRWSPSEAVYAGTAYYARDTDRLGLFGRLEEDGLFGAYTREFENGYTISRDLLDSINQANVIARLLGRAQTDRIDLLDIGAGYGRLAQRLTEGLPRAHVTSTDAVPLSTFLCDFYLKFRNTAERTEVVPLDQAAQRLPQKKFDLVTNFHSFSECTLRAITWWLDLLSQVEVGKLLIIPNAVDKFRSTETNGEHLDFLPLLDERGWKLASSEPVYAASQVAQRSALYPNFRFYLFER
jgi:SAM-dependent methyltransferase